MDGRVDCERASEDLDDDERTLQRAPQIPLRARPPPALRPTLRVPYTDERLLAIARGEMEPDETFVPEGEDPFGGLIPVDDDDLGALEHLLDLPRVEP